MPYIPGYSNSIRPGIKFLIEGNLKVTYHTTQRLQPQYTNHQSLTFSGFVKKSKFPDIRHPGFPYFQMI